MQTPEWEDNDSLDFTEAGAPLPVKPAAKGDASGHAGEQPGEKVHILALRRRFEERLDSKRIEMEYGLDYLDDESIQ
ncbi:MAG: hypothetical protein OXE54_04105 [Gammaproteobacteria bacterium]|nr:hypothetical protein [Gammaproteobacteria bacterium]